MFLDGENMIGIVHSMRMSPLPHLFGHEMCSLVRNNVMLNIVLVVVGDKIFCRSICTNFGGSIMSRESKLIHRISVYASNNRQSLHHDGSGPVQPTCH